MQLKVCRIHFQLDCTVLDLPPTPRPIGLAAVHTTSPHPFTPIPTPCPHTCPHLSTLQVGAGLKPVSIVSYNHLGNNDGCNLSAPQTFRSKV